MKPLIFDMDDTLYDQLVPFQRSVEKNFDFSVTDMEALYLTFRKFSDAMFHQSERGEIPMEEMRIYRIQQACQEFGWTISDAEAQAFQSDYARFQGEIELTDDMRKILDHCLTNQIPLGVITNGPTAHQWRKVHQLQLTNWIPAEHIFISSEVGVAKPNKEIFQLVEERLSVPAAELTYIGDSYANDVIGAKDSGWQVIWLNRRNHAPLENPARQDHCLTKEQAVFPLIKKLFTER